MITREDRERLEAQIMDPRAALASNSAGRQRPEEQDPIRTVYQRDRDRIIHSDAFRRLSHKTQVFIAPENDHYRTRLTHTLEVAQISRTIARALGLNEDLTEAIALAHDLGHTPFGHAGEAALNQALFRYHGMDPDSQVLFEHHLQSLRVVDHIEGEGKGLNLTFEVRDGIVHHTGAEKAQTLEGRIVAIADRIAYVNHDIDDALRAGLISEDQIPADAVALLGTTRSERIDTMVTDMIQESQRQGEIVMTQPIWDTMMTLRAFLNQEVYRKADAKEQARVHEVIDSLFGYYIHHPERIPELYLQETGGDQEQAAVDCIASMTDRYALTTFKELFTESMLP